MTKGSMYKKFHEVRPCFFRLMQADRHTYIPITLLCMPPGGELTIITRIPSSIWSRLYGLL